MTTDSKDRVEGARNVIVFVGDGMGVSTVTAARIFDGQSKGMAGEENWLAFERFQNVALVKTYNTNQQVPDSAGTATAMFTGEKTRAGVISVGAAAKRQDCRAALRVPLESIADMAKEKGLSAGVVTTARLTHATPATLYAHSPEREWEGNRYLDGDDWAAGCRDIAYQLVHRDPGMQMDVAMGGGRRAFYGPDNGGRRRNAQDDLVTDWRNADPKRQFVSTAAEMAGLTSAAPVLGLFSSSHMTYMAEREPDSTEPTLSQMTETAIDLLDDNRNGYFLLVEGGRIDHGHHDSKPGYAMLETQEFNRAIEVALGKVDLDDTMILVTADHSHVFTIAGYPTRGNPILGLVVGNDDSGEPNNSPTLADDGQPYTTLGYANGSGAVRGERQRPEVGINAVAQSLIPVVDTNTDGSIDRDETHGGEDVALYGTGAGANNVRGVIEQNTMYDIMLQAYGWQNARR